MRKNLAEYRSIAKYLFANWSRTRIKRELLKIDFCKVHRVPSSLSNSRAHITHRKDAHKGKGWGAHMNFTLLSEKDAR